MKHVQILDCTLRDGGYIVDGIFGNNVINGIIEKLCNAKLDIIEVGFLKDVEYRDGSSTYDCIERLKTFLPKAANDTKFVAMIDYGRYDIKKLPQNNDNLLYAIRNCFFKKDRYAAVSTSQMIQKCGYKLFVQPVDILGYTDKELIELAEITNTLKPYAFSIVDTFGSMYEEDLVRVFSLLNNNLDKDIKFGFHSHNNLQMSFALSQKIIQLCLQEREVIIDTTLCGMGRGAGNTNTELLVNYLNKKYNYGYNANEIMDLIDMHIAPIMREKQWGYSIPYFIAGAHSAHVHNISYLLDKHKVCSRDLQMIIGLLDEDIKKRYDYNNLENLYIKYFGNEIDDSSACDSIKQILKDKHVLILAPGKSIIEYETKINDFQKLHKDSLITVAVNFVPDRINVDMLFFSNNMRFEYAKQKHKSAMDLVPQILTSNIKTEDGGERVVNYNNLIKRKWHHFDNAIILLLSLLQKINCKNAIFAGFDGYVLDENNSYSDKNLQTEMSTNDKNELNFEIYEMLKEIANSRHSKINLSFLTPSIFEKVTKQY